MAVACKKYVTAGDQVAAVRIAPLLGTPPESRQQTGGKSLESW